jgi:SAM-dependent methyltransferase
MAVPAAVRWREAAVDFYDREAVAKSLPRRHALFVTAYSGLARRMGLGPDASLLDAGCGCGELQGALAGEVRQVIGVDLSPVSLRVAQAFHPRAPFLGADFSRLPFGRARFDGVAALTSLEFCPDKHAAFKEINRVLKVGGRFYFDVRNAGFLPLVFARPFTALFSAAGLLKPYPAEGFRDLSLDEWRAFAELHGFRLLSRHRSLWPWNFGSPLTRAKNLLIEAVKILAPLRRHYMVGLLWEKLPD